jgi:ribosomal protein S18 acetylase RimI-like enzyme
MKRRVTIIAVSGLFPVPISSFAGGNTLGRPTRSAILQLAPIIRYKQDMTFLSESDDYRCCIGQDGRFADGYELSVIEEEDLPDLARFVVSAFGADAISFSQDLNAMERLIVSPVAGLLNGYSGLMAFVEVLSGTKQRAANRLKRMDILAPKVQGLELEERIYVAARDSLVLAIGKEHVGNDALTDIIATIELRLQPCDAKIPFSLPWLDSVERKLGLIIGLGDGVGKDLQPYLSNLCVDERYRGRGIGRALVRCVENVAMSWGYSRMYLHVDTDNKSAFYLYKSEGYRDVGHRWNPFWAGSSADIGYFVKTLEPKT